MELNNHTYTSIYIDKDLLRKAKAKAKAEGVSFSKLVERVIAKAVKVNAAG